MKNTLAEKLKQLPREYLVVGLIHTKRSMPLWQSLKISNTGKVQIR